MTTATAKPDETPGPSTSTVRGKLILLVAKIQAFEAQSKKNHPGELARGHAEGEAIYQAEELRDLADGDEQATEPWTEFLQTNEVSPESRNGYKRIYRRWPEVEHLGPNASIRSALKILKGASRKKRKPVTITITLSEFLELAREHTGVGTNPTLAGFVAAVLKTNAIDLETTTPNQENPGRKARKSAFLRGDEGRTMNS